MHTRYKVVDINWIIEKLLLIQYLRRKNPNKMTRFIIKVLIKIQNIQIRSFSTEKILKILEIITSLKIR